jgi:hypothetical protein
MPVGITLALVQTLGVGRSDENAVAVLTMARGKSKSLGLCLATGGGALR